MSKSVLSLGGGEKDWTGVGSIQVAMKGRKFGYSSRVPRSMGTHYFCL